MNWYINYKQSSLSKNLSILSKELASIAINGLKEYGIYFTKTIFKNGYDISDRKLKILFITKVVNFDAETVASNYFVIGGKYNVRTNEMIIEISLNKHFLKNNEKISNYYLNNLYFELLNVIRHELEHLYQEMTGSSQLAYFNVSVYNNKNIFAQIKKYFLQEDEIEAMASGLYLKAKKTNRSFKETIKDFVQGIFDSYASSRKEEVINFEKEHGPIENTINEIVNAIYDYARKRYHLDTQPNRVVQFKPSTELVESK